MRTANVVRRSATGVVYDSPCLLSALFLNTDTNGEGVTLYNAHYADAGSMIGHFITLANITFTYTFPLPVYIERGLYAVFDAGAVEIGVAIIVPPVLE
jgi:hypothetical protein